MLLSIHNKKLNVKFKITKTTAIITTATFYRTMNDKSLPKNFLSAVLFSNFLKPERYKISFILSALSPLSVIGCSKSKEFFTKNYNLDLFFMLFLRRTRVFGLII